MAMNSDGSIVLTTQVDQTGINKGLNTMKSGVSSMSKAFGKLGLMLAAVFSVRAIANFTKSAKQAYNLQMEAETKLATIMRQRIGATDSEIDRIKKLTAEQQKLGVVGDEVQIAGAQQLATFSTETKTLETLIPAMNNLIAQQRGLEASTGDAVNVANLMGKALMGQASALRRVGITFSEAEENAIKYGNESQRAAVLAQVIKNNVGEMNFALAQTDAGRQKQLANTFGDIKEQFGQAFTQISILLLPLLNSVAKILERIANVARQAAQAIANMFGKKLQTAPSVVAETVENQNDLTDAIKETTKAQKGSVAEFDEVKTLAEKSADAQGGAGASISGAAMDYVPQDMIDSSQFDALLGKIKNIAEQAKKIWDSKPIQAFVNTGVKFIGFLGESFTTLGSSLVDNSKQTFSNIEGNLETTGNNLVRLWTSVWTELGKGMDKWGTPIIKGVDKLFNTIWRTVIDPFAQNLTQVWAGLSLSLVELWDEHGAGLVDRVGLTIYTIIEQFQRLYDSIIEPIITPFFEQFSFLWNKHMQPLVTKIGDFVLTFIESAMDLYNKVIQPVRMWIYDILSPAISFLSNLVSGVLSSIYALTMDIIGSVIGVFTGLIDFLTGVFTLNWRKAWEGVRSIFKNIVDGLWGIMKFPLNLIIDGINALISGLNKVSFDVPDWVPGIGGKTFGFDIPKIPKLAQGGIVPYQTLAMLGEGNKKEAVLPLEQNTEWMDILATKIASQISAGGFSGTIEVPVNIDGREIARAVRTGESQLGSQTVFGRFANAY